VSGHLDREYEISSERNPSDTMTHASVRLSTFSSILGLMVLVAAGGGAALHRFRPRSPVARGVVIDDRRVPDDAPAVTAWLASRTEAARARTVRFRCDRQILEATFEAAGIALDAQATLDGATRVAHEGSWWQQVRESERARRGEIEVPPVWALDEQKARALLTALAPSVARDPVEAQIDLTKHTRTPDEPGRALDVDASLARLRLGTHEDGEIIDLVTHRVPAKITLDQLTQVNVEKVVSAYETTFSLFGTGAGRAVNIKNAVARFDGLVLSPGQTFSFNDVVGPRTRERGFALAPEIQGEELQLGYGGGTCQASSTLHAAALFGALDVLERVAHSRPSSYTQMGLDATVSYPLTDLKIRNSLRYPILIHAFLPRPNAVRIEILGGDPVAKVDYVYAVGATEDFVRRVDVKDNLRSGQRVLHQKGIQGFDVTSVVKYHYFDGRQDERHYSSGYRPTPEIYWVAPGYDVAALPPLPEHAKSADEGVGG
jgi:vancomycin resistance protein YoaR